jgi:aldose 1-epimerase
MEPISTQVFGNMPDGQAVPLYLLTNSQGSELRLFPYGATWVGFRTADRNGKPEEVVLGLDSLKDYLQADTNYGGIVGRYANRIGTSQIEVDGQSYQLALNLQGNVHLHGGTRGFEKYLWQAEPREESGRAGVRFRHLSPDGDEGYPGNLQASLTYWLTEANEVVLEYEATTDKPTVVNLSNHAYFNLSGDLKRDVLGHRLQLFADAYTPTNKIQVPTGALTPVVGTPLDFREPKALGAEINDNHHLMRIGNGYDHNLVVNGSETQPAPVARVEEPESGRRMEVFATQPGVQLYTANWFDGSQKGMGGKPFHKRHAFCLETQHFPDSPNHPNFPSTVLRPGETYHEQAVYRFSTS